MNSFMFALFAQMREFELNDDVVVEAAPMNPAVLGLTALFVVVIFAAMWRVFTKAGEPGWAAIIPIYNIIVMLRIAGMPLWWLLVMLIPLVNIIPGFMMPVKIAERFGKGMGFALGLIFLPFIFYPILGFGDARYTPQDLQRVRY